MTNRQQREYLRIGIITGAHGLSGRLKVTVLTDLLERFAPESIVYIGTDATQRPCRITQFLPGRGKSCYLHIEGIDDRTQAESLKGMVLSIDRDQAEATRDLLDEDSFYYYDIIGCDVWRGDERFGTVVDIMQAGAGEILVINSTEGKQYLVPFVAAMVDTAAIAQRKLVIMPIEGLLED